MALILIHVRLQPCAPKRLLTRPGPSNSWKHTVHLSKKRHRDTAQSRSGEAAYPRKRVKLSEATKAANLIFASEESTFSCEAGFEDFTVTCPRKPNHRMVVFPSAAAGGNICLAKRLRCNRLARDKNCNAAKQTGMYLCRYLCMCTTMYVSMYVSMYAHYAMLGHDTDSEHNENMYLR